MRRTLTILILTIASTLLCVAQNNPTDGQRNRRRTPETFVTDTPMVHDPVMAYEDGTYYLFSTGWGIQMMSSQNRKLWRTHTGVSRINTPVWATDSVPGFRGHMWAPDVIRYAGKWWMAYSCSTFGRNTSAIGLASTPTLNPNDSINYHWEDHGPIVCSREGRDHWNAIDPCFVLDEKGEPWLTWGSFWDGIQLIRLNPETMHVASGEKPVTIARRIPMADTLKVEANPTSKHAGRNAIEAPFVLRHGSYYYLFVSHDYCCRGMQSNYKVVVGRSKSICGPYLDRDGRDMAQGGGTLVIEGDKKEFEAAGHCAAYNLASFDPALPDEDLFICHGYSISHGGQSILIQRAIRWTADGWPEI